MPPTVVVVVVITEIISLQLAQHPSLLASYVTPSLCQLQFSRGSEFYVCCLADGATTERDVKRLRGIDADDEEKDTLGPLISSRVRLINVFSVLNVFRVLGRWFRHDACGIESCRCLRVGSVDEGKSSVDTASTSGGM